MGSLKTPVGRGLLLLLLAATARGAMSPEEQRLKYGYEEVVVLGWNEGCSVAIRHFRYPAVVEGSQADPASGRMGTVTLEPDQSRAAVKWALQVKEGSPYTSHYAAATQTSLQRVGYTRPGYVERVRPEPVVPGKGFERLKSTGSLEVGYALPWASAPYAMSRIHYSPLGTCAFVVFERPGVPPNLFKYQLARVPVEVRRKRAEAHVAHALALYHRQSDLYGALEEAEIAATMDPRLAQARYHYAALLATHGRNEEALKELREAVLLDDRYVKAATEAVEFEELRKQPRFKKALELQAGVMPLRPR